MVSQYPVSSDPFMAPAKQSASRQAASRQDRDPSSFERHLRDQAPRETSRSNEGRDTVARQDRPERDHKASNSSHRDRAEIDSSARERPTSDPADQARSASRDQADKTKAHADHAPSHSGKQTDKLADVEQRAETSAEPSDQSTNRTVISEPVAPVQPNTSVEADGSITDLLLTGQEHPAESSGMDAPEVALQSVENSAQTAINLTVEGDGSPAIAPEAGGITEATQGANNINSQQPAPTGTPTADGEPQPVAHRPAQPMPSEGSQTPITPVAETALADTGQAMPNRTPTSDSQQQTSLQAPEPMNAVVGEEALEVSDEGIQTARVTPLQSEQGGTQQPTSVLDGQPTPQIVDAVPAETPAEPITQNVSSHDGEVMPNQKAVPVTPEGEAPVAVETKSTEPFLQQSATNETGLPTDTLDQVPMEKQAATQSQAPVVDTVPSEQASASGSTPKSAGTEQSQSQAQLVAAHQALGKKGIELPQATQQSTTASENPLASAAPEGGDDSALPKQTTEQASSITEPVNSILKQAPKADAFTKMMAGLNNQGGLQDITMQNDPTLKVDVATPFQGDPTTVRLTGMESFARTGQVPQQAAAANAQAMAAQISKFAQKGETRFEIRLDPADLGKVDVRLTIGSDGQTRAHLFVERPETLDMFMRDQRMMERSLMQSGLNLDKQGLEFSLMDQQDSGQQMAQDQQETMDQDIYGSDGSTNVDDFPDAPALQANHSGNYVASNGVNLVI